MTKNNHISQHLVGVFTPPASHLKLQSDYATRAQRHCGIPCLRSSLLWRRRLITELLIGSDHWDSGQIKLVPAFTYWEHPKAKVRLTVLQCWSVKVLKLFIWLSQCESSLLLSCAAQLDSGQRTKVSERRRLTVLLSCVQCDQLSSAVESLFVLFFFLLVRVSFLRCRAVKPTALSSNLSSWVKWAWNDPIAELKSVLMSWCIASVTYF